METEVGNDLLTMARAGRRAGITDMDLSTSLPSLSPSPVPSAVKPHRHSSTALRGCRVNELGL